jgi:hypothetical protein
VSLVVSPSLDMYIVRMYTRRSCLLSRQAAAAYPPPVRTRRPTPAPQEPARSHVRQQKEAGHVHSTGFPSPRAGPGHMTGADFGNMTFHKMAACVVDSVLRS